MKKVYSIMIIALFIIAVTFIGVVTFNSNSNEKLIIYTYDSLLADPGFAFDRAFENFAGLDNGSVKVVLFDDVGSMIARAAQEKEQPVADVIIGVDNTFIGKARSEGIFEVYEPGNASMLIDGLADELAPDYLVTPYDYGVISLWYSIDRLQGRIYENFTLNDLLSKQLAQQTIVEDPRLSSPGLGFLLHTIAIFGDNKTGVNGVIDGDWEDYWANLAQNVRISPSWGDAYELFASEEEGRPMMVSYTSSPAYGNCLYDDNSTAALLTHEMGKQWGWRQVEGIGLVNNSKHSELAKQFIDWFISPAVQDKIYLNQWMYPALKNINMPDCYSISPSFDQIEPLNSRIPINVLNENLDDYLQRWETAVAT